MRKITHFNPTFSLAFLALFLWWSCLSGSETTRIRVAILDIEVAGIDSIVKIGLSNRLGAEIIKTGQFNVLERTRMQEILQEQGFQQTGVCNTDECIVEAGRVLGVSKMIAGSVAKVGNLFTISIRMIDVSTGRILFSATEDTPGPIENVLTTSLGNAAKKISVMAIAKPEEGLTGFGILRLESDPSEARIFIDDKIIPGETPILMDSISAGVHVVRFQKNLMAASQAIFVAPNEQTVVKLKLSRAKGRLKIVTRPEGAEILLDYESKGFSPS
ncbi:MAG: CsgG/HfaB family protein, partial [Methanosarcinaceae archaeon]